MSTSFFDKQDIFIKKMIEDYQEGLFINPIYKPYFDWKTGETSILKISKQEARAIISDASNELEKYYVCYPDAYKDLDSYINDDAWQHYKGFGKDKYIVSYLEAIEYEVNNLLMAGMIF